MDLKSSNRESLEKILLNPDEGFIFESFGCMGLVVTFHPIWMMVDAIATITPIT